MLASWTKKKLSDNQVANIFINSIFHSVDNGFSEVASMINDDPAFVKSPEINEKENGEFGLIVVVGNLCLLESTFDAEHASSIETLIVEKLAKVYEMPLFDFTKLVNEYKSYFARINHPSKNTLYAMSKAVFHKYELNCCQDDYFRRMQAPNPLFLKRMDEVMTNFLWNWDAFFKKYRLA
ncbi:MAG: hypothetical protein V4638_11730 [Bacteroidota bacterium]